MSASGPGRVTLIDALKGIASQFIVLHHLAFYGPMSDVAWPLAPDLLAWFAHEARYAVQVFLVVGGFLAARGLAPQGRLVVGPVAPVLWNRYVRLGVPYMAMLVLAVAASALAGRWMTHPSISGAPSLPQVLAHLVLMHDVLGYEALSAGVWYVAIDLQLFALMLGLLWMARRFSAALGQGTRAAVAWSLCAVGAMVLASLMHFNLDPRWDVWALYFFGAYGLGAFAWWGSHRKASWGGLVALAALGSLALAMEWRDRLMVAVAVALLLGVARRLGARSGWRAEWPGAGGRAFAWLGQMSYSLFLVHFPVCLVVNAVFQQFVPASPPAHLLGVILAWAASITAGWGFHVHVERRTSLLIWRPPSATRVQGT